MNLKDRTRQSVLGLFTVNRSISILAGAFLVLIVALVFYISPQDNLAESTSTPRKILSGNPWSERAIEPVAPRAPAPESLTARIADGPGAEPILTQQMTRGRRSEQPPTLADLESQFRSTYDKEEKKDLLRLIAGWNNRDAVAVLTRLFQAERHPDARQAVLVALGDVDPSEGVQERLALLTFATQRQPRDVRMAALDLLDTIDDPRSTKLIQQLMRNDPDREVREAAKVIYDAKSPER